MPGDQGIWTPEAMEAAAREALKPIQEWYHKAMACEADANDLAPLIFTTEELER